MPDYDFFRDEFDRLAVNGYIGDPSGLDAKALLRVSTGDQSEDGRTGLPRQVMHVHEVAQKEHLRVSWLNVYADDESGWILERPGLQRLLRDTADLNCPERAVIIEDIDRLSRDSSWHQGFLIHQFEEVRKVRLVFWQPIGSRLERAVKGVIADEAMRQAKARMSAARLIKATHGSVTATSKPALGYRRSTEVVEVRGKMRRLDSYEVVESEANLMRRIFESLVYGCKSIRQTALEFAEEMRALGRSCGPTIIRQMVRNPVYKGEFIANRYGTRVVYVPNDSGEMVKRRHTYERPRSEWITVPVPQIVSPALWDAGQEALSRHKTLSTRNGRHPYLLTGLLHCESCGYAWNGYVAKKDKGNGVVYEYPRYRCTSKVLKKERSAMGVTCDQTYAARADEIDTAVWSVVRGIMDDPEHILALLDQKYSGEENARITNQITYLEGEIDKERRSDEKDRRVLDLGGYDEAEFAGLHLAHKKRIEALNQSILDLRARCITPETIAGQKRVVMEMVDYARQHVPAGAEAPFDVRRAIIRNLVKKVFVDVKNSRIRLEGQIYGQFTLAVEPIDDGELGGDKGGDGGNGGNSGGGGNGSGGFTPPSKRGTVKGKAGKGRLSFVSSASQCHRYTTRRPSKTGTGCGRW